MRSCGISNSVLMVRFPLNLSRCTCPETPLCYIGRYLATCSWDRTAIIWLVGDPFTIHRTLAHPTSFVGQVAWSPDGSLLMTKLTRSIKIWTTVCASQVLSTCFDTNMTRDRTECVRRLSTARGVCNPSLGSQAVSDLRRLREAMSGSW